MGSIAWGEHGQRLTNVVREAYLHPFRIQSDYARAMAEWVALAASLGFITVIVGSYEHTREWRPTQAGLLYLKERHSNV